jgi:hypothetical protein
VGEGGVHFNAGIGFLSSSSSVERPSFQPATPVLIGSGGKAALAGPGALNIADAKHFQLEDVVRIGRDVRLTATPLR